MTQVSEQYIRDLEPESLRYDVSLEEDFVISVLPNGIKTWAFLYEYKGRQRRKTLGIYPEMSYAQANLALGNARSMVSRLGEGIDTFAQSEPSNAAPGENAANDLAAARPAILASGYRRRGGYSRRKSRKPAKWPKYVLYAVALLAVAGVVYLALTTFDSGDTASTPVPADPVVPAVEKKRPTAPARNPFGTRSDSAQPDTSSETAPLKDPAPPDEQNQSNDADGGEMLNEDLAPTSDSGDSNEAGTQIRAAPTNPGATAAVSDAQVSVSGNPDSELYAADDELPATEVAQTAPAVEDAPAQSAREPPPAAAEQPASVTVVPQRATSIGGTVTRAVVTSGIDDLEPVDNIGDHIALDDNGFQSVFFFTELRNFSDGNVIHRWEHNGSVLADVPLRVAKSWRWRTYSSKDLLPGMMGDWSVSVIDANGEILASRSFTFDNE